MSIIDVARVAGVSKSTVSRVVNGGRRVSPETLEQVRRAMRQLGHRPNELARGLLRGRTNTIGLVLFLADGSLAGRRRIDRDRSRQPFQEWCNAA